MVFSSMDVLSLLVQINAISSDNEGSHLISGMDALYWRPTELQLTTYDEVLAYVISKNNYTSVTGLKLVLNPAKSRDIIAQHRQDYE